jgi:Recombination endonuclease VII
MGWDKERYATDPVYRSRSIAATKSWERANPDKVSARGRRHKLRRIYGLTTADYEAMVARQDGLCAVCRRRPVKRLCVDHSHETKMLRSLLCHGCNRGLGDFEDNPEFLRAGADYLEIWRIIHARKGANAKLIPIRISKPKKRKDTKCLPSSPLTTKPRPRD